MRGPLGRAGAKVTSRTIEAPSPSRGTEPEVAPADLSRPPSPPVLDEALARNYPDSARQNGLTGKAVVRARVLAQGTVRDLAVVSESAPGFGEACKATLADSRWSAPLDRDGRPVATTIHYTCRFTTR
jgi:TonB family protein